MSEKFDSLCLEEMDFDVLSEVMAVERLAYPFPWTESMFASSLSSKDECCVLTLEQKVVGYSVVSRVLDETHLLNLCIHPDFEGLGLGRILLRELIQDSLKKCSSMFFLEVRASNARAINLYFSEGFNEMGVRPNYYPSDKGREDAILMTLDLTVDIVI